jgi:hypothetical protein
VKENIYVDKSAQGAGPEYPRHFAITLVAAPEEQGGPMSQSFSTSAGGPWTVRHESARNVLLAGPTVWSLICEHESGWRIVHEEFAEQAMIFAPDGEVVGAVPEKRHNPSSHRMIAALTLWVEEHAAALGLPGLGELN